MEGRMENKTAALCCAAVLLIFTAMLINPQLREHFRSTSAAYPLTLGFVKFFFLATAGELLAIRISSGLWNFPKLMLIRALIWGCIGASLALLLKVYAGGVMGLFSAGVLPGRGNRLCIAFTTSLIMNVTFAPVMMIFHKMSDTWVGLKAEGKKRGLCEIIAMIDWYTLFSFVIFKTIPYFWIPAHTITFTLAPEYQTSMAAILSVALGIILSLKKKGAEK